MSAVSITFPYLTDCDQKVKRFLGRTARGFHWRPTGVPLACHWLPTGRFDFPTTATLVDLPARPPGSKLRPRSELQGGNRWVAAPNAAMTRRVIVNGAWCSISGAHWASFSVASVALPSSVALGEKSCRAAAYAMTGRGRIPLRPLAIRAVAGDIQARTKCQRTGASLTGASEPVPTSRSQRNRQQIRIVAAREEFAC